ncbi:DUF131 domain-containing protein [Candidatus Bathyarchaeota archaeon]|nr:DUF131 domain-containing protein [Candidatus Bathyarchaeota archaeon]
MFFLGFALIIIGLIISLIAALMMVLGGLRGRRVRGGGLIMIGPIPIIFGTDREAAKILIILSTVLIIAALIFVVVLGLLGR